MISVELNKKVIQVSHSHTIYSFTDENGQIKIDSIVAFQKKTPLELLQGEITYQPTENEQIDNGLKLFISTLFSKLSEVKANAAEQSSYGAP